MALKEACDGLSEVATVVCTESGKRSHEQRFIHDDVSARQVTYHPQSRPLVQSLGRGGVWVDSVLLGGSGSAESPHRLSHNAIFSFRVYGNCCGIHRRRGFCRRGLAATDCRAGIVGCVGDKDGKP